MHSTLQDNLLHSYTLDLPCKKTYVSKRKHGTPCHMASLCLFWLEKFTPYHEILGKDEIVTWTHIEKERKIHDREILYNYFGFLNRLIKALLEKTDFYFWLITTKCPYNRNTLFGTFHQAKFQNLNMLETQIAYLYSWILYSSAYILTFTIQCRYIC